MNKKRKVMFLSISASIIAGLFNATLGAPLTASQTDGEDTMTPSALFDHTVYSKPIKDAPVLAKLGSYAVGVQTLSFTDENRPSINAALKGGLTETRTVTATVWYPAQETGNPVTYKGRLPFRPGYVPENAPQEYQFQGLASENAAPTSDTRFPLVVISHGYGNWAEHLSYLGENLASKGYVVASIEHKDQPYTNFQEFQLSFGSVLLNRVRDQRLVIEGLNTLAQEANTPLSRIMDGENIGLIGYSMGGYGVLASAGAGYDPESVNYAQIPAPLTTGIMAGEQFQKPHPALKAVIALAPWGGAPANRAWSAEALSDIRVPLLFVSGDEDDVSGYGGIRWLFDNATNAPRQMLVYENARHNVGGNPPPPIAAEYFDLIDWFDEPVWRRDRITAINQHFVTAFMGLHLKGQADMQSYLDVKPERANDGEWPAKLGEYTGDTVSPGEHAGKSYWKGFQRRQALGLKMIKPE